MEGEEKLGKVVHCVSESCRTCGVRQVYVAGVCGVRHVHVMMLCVRC